MKILTKLVVAASVAGAAGAVLAQTSHRQHGGAATPGPATAGTMDQAAMQRMVA